VVLLNTEEEEGKGERIMEMIKTKQEQKEE
jgi:hypothetical protein